MEIEKVIIHELNKPIGSGAKLRKSRKLLDNSHEDVIQLVKELNGRYRRKDEKQGIFDEANPTIFHESFREFYTIKTDEKFIAFSHASAENLRERIEGIGSAKGGYLVYALYKDIRKYFSVFFVRDTTSIAFKRNKTVESFDLNKVQHIDFERLAMACRINMQIFNETNKKYLSFIHKKSDTFSKYFINWISTTDTVTSEEETKSLLQVLKLIPLPNENIERESIITAVYKYINANPTKTANLFDISRSVFEDEDYLANYIYQYYPEIPTEFKAHTSTLKRFVKVYAKAEGIELNFPPAVFHEGKIKFNSTNESQLIINSKELVEQVKFSLLNE